MTKHAIFLGLATALVSTTAIAKTPTSKTPILETPTLETPSLITPNLGTRFQCKFEQGNLQLTGGNNFTGIDVFVEDSAVITDLCRRKYPLSEINQITVYGNGQIRFLNYDQGLQLNLPDISIKTGNLDDTIIIEGQWGDTYIVTNGGDDSVSIGSQLTTTTLKGLVIQTGAGSDEVTIFNSGIKKTTDIDTGHDPDIVTLTDNTFVEAVSVQTGLKDDSVTLMGNSFNSTQFYDGGGDIDTFTSDDVVIPGTVVNFETVQVDSLEILSSQRTVYARSSYSGEYLDTTNSPPQLVDIDEFDEQDLSFAQSGAWSETASTGVLQFIFGNSPGTDPITASANQQSDISASSGNVSIDLFSDQYWGSNNPNLFSGPSGIARANASYSIIFRPIANGSLSFEGFLSTNFATMGNTNVPKGSASVVVKALSSNTNVYAVAVNINSDVSFNDLQETLDGTSVNLTGGEVYEMVITGVANSDASTSASNAEGEIEVSWEYE